MEDIKFINVVHTVENNKADSYLITFEFNRKMYSHVKERLIPNYLLMATANELKITEDDMHKIKTVINDDDFYVIEHLNKITSVIELIYRFPTF
jgi:hypothetical protein